VSLHLRQTSNGLRQRGFERLNVDPGVRQQGRGRTVLLLQQGEQQMLRLDEGIVVTDGDALGIGQGLLKLGREFVQTHAALLAERSSMNCKWGRMAPVQSSDGRRDAALRQGLTAGSGGASVASRKQRTRHRIGLRYHARQH